MYRDEIIPSIEDMDNWLSFDVNYDSPVEHLMVDMMIDERKSLLY